MNELKIIQIRTFLCMLCGAVRRHSMRTLYSWVVRFSGRLFVPSIEVWCTGFSLQTLKWRKIKWIPQKVLQQCANVMGEKKTHFWLILWKMCPRSIFFRNTGTNVTLHNQPARSTQPGHPSVGRHNEYQPQGGDGLLLESKGRYVSFAGGR